MSKQAAPQVAERFRQLVEQLGESRGLRRGWKGEVSKQLGIPASELSKILSGKREAGWEVASRAATAIGLNPTFFQDREGHFLSYVELPPEQIPVNRGMRLLEIARHAHEIQGIALEGRPLNPVKVRTLAHEVMNSRLTLAARRVIAATRADDLAHSADDLVHLVIEEATAGRSQRARPNVDADIAAEIEAEAADNADPPPVSRTAPRRRK